MILCIRSKSYKLIIVAKKSRLCTM